MKNQMDDILLQQQQGLLSNHFMGVCGHWRKKRYCEKRFFENTWKTTHTEC